MFPSNSWSAGQSLLEYTSFSTANNVLKSFKKELGKPQDYAQPEQQGLYRKSLLLFSWCDTRQEQENVIYSCNTARCKAMKPDLPTACKGNFSLGFYVEMQNLDRGEANDFEHFSPPLLKGNHDIKEKVAAQQHCTVTESSGLQTCQKLS